MRGLGWVLLIQEEDQLRVAVEKVVILRVSQRADNFLSR
jgi:hypothetical protein